MAGPSHWSVPCPRSSSPPRPQARWVSVATTDLGDDARKTQGISLTVNYHTGLMGCKQ